MVAVYDERTSPSSSTRKALTSQVFSELVESFKDVVTNKLSENETLHVYRETAEERLMLGFVSLLNARRTDQAKTTKGEYKKTLKALQEENKRNSRYKAVFDNPDILAFYLNFLDMGEAYHGMSCFKLSWAMMNMRAKWGGVRLVHYLYWS